MNLFLTQTYSEQNSYDSHTNCSWFVQMFYLGALFLKYVYNLSIHSKAGFTVNFVLDLFQHHLHVYTIYNLNPLIQLVAWIVMTAKYFHFRWPVHSQIVRPTFIYKIRLLSFKFYTKTLKRMSVNIWLRWNGRYLQSLFHPFQVIIFPCHSYNAA